VETRASFGGRVDKMRFFVMGRQARATVRALFLNGKKSEIENSGLVGSISTFNDD
jgi:hypothetical protein